MPVLAGVTVLAVLLGVGYGLRHSSTAPPGSSGGTPPMLHLSDYAAAAADGAPNRRYQLLGTLPDGPDSAPVRWLTKPSDDDATALARALGVLGRRTSQGGATIYTAGGGVLRVQDDAGGQWQYGRGATTESLTCPPHPTATPTDKGLDLYLSCDVATSGSATSESGSATGSATTGSATGGGPATSASAALKVARPVLVAAGIDPDRARVSPPAMLVTVTADPRVGDLPTDGMTTAVAVTGNRVISGGGWLGGTRDGDSYPVVSAQQAWQRLMRTPLAQPLLPCREAMPPGSDPAICGGPVRVTGAHFGLSLHYQGERPVLVPSWLFDVRGSEHPLSVVAVEDDYLDSTPATGGGSEPGSPGTSVPPSSATGSLVPDPPEPVSPNSRFSSVTTSRSGATLTATFFGGVDSCYDYTVLATERGSRVALSLVEKSTTTDGVCDDLAQQYEKSVVLHTPLGTRRVVDAETGAVLLNPSR